MQVGQEINSIEELRALINPSSDLFDNSKSRLSLNRIMRTDGDLVKNMARHYSAPKGFVGRNICYQVSYCGKTYGHIVGGSATRFLPGRNEFFGMTIEDLNFVVNNIFFHIEKIGGKYPIRNFAQSVIAMFRRVIFKDWTEKYGDKIIGFESLVELPRSGECYRRDGWIEVGKTIGYTCKRTSGKGTDDWSGKRVWDTENLRPKLVFARKP